MFTAQDVIRYFMCKGLSKEEAIKKYESIMRMKLPETILRLLEE
jgi:hypothetical protein